MTTNEWLWLLLPLISTYWCVGITYKYTRAWWFYDLVHIIPLTYFYGVDAFRVTIWILQGIVYYAGDDFD